jgi:hypothetical protein
MKPALLFDRLGGPLSVIAIPCHCAGACHCAQLPAAPIAPSFSATAPAPAKILVRDEWTDEQGDICVRFREFHLVDVGDETFHYVER